MAVRLLSLHCVSCDCFEVTGSAALITAHQNETLEGISCKAKQFSFVCTELRVLLASCSLLLVVYRGSSVPLFGR